MAQRTRSCRGEEPVGAVLSNGDYVYFIDDSIFNEQQVVAVCYGRGFVGAIGFSVGTVLSAKLHVQSQFGFPVSCMDVKKTDGASWGDHELCDRQAQIFVS